MQRLVGPEAGGHPGIAGSPRGQDMSLRELDKVIDTLQDYLRG